MRKKNEPKEFIAKKEEAKKETEVEITANVVKLKGGEIDVYKAKPIAVETIDSERIELAKSCVDAWNRIGVVVHESSHDKYTLNNIYVILETALKKALLAHK